MIKKLRESKKITQEQMSIYLKISLRHYQNVESYRAIPSVVIGHKIALILESDIPTLWIDYI